MSDGHYYSTATLAVRPCPAHPSTHAAAEFSMREAAPWAIVPIAEEADALLQHDPRAGAFARRLGPYGHAVSVVVHPGGDAERTAKARISPRGVERAARHGLTRGP